MIFGNETPFHLKPLPNRGIRKNEAEAIQHYPGYRHPLEPSPQNVAYISDIHRLHPTLTVNDELKHEREERHLKKDQSRQLRQSRYLAREAKLLNAREVEYQRQQERAAQLIGTSMKNMMSDHQDVITHQCHTREAQEKVAANVAVDRQRYFSRQRELDRRVNPTGYNIITWQPRREV